MSTLGMKQPKVPQAYHEKLRELANQNSSIREQIDLAIKLLIDERKNSLPTGNFHYLHPPKNAKPRSYRITQSVIESIKDIAQMDNVHENTIIYTSIVRYVD